MTVVFTPTREYLPQYYAQCDDMIQICNALDELYFQRFFDDVCLKTQIYFLFRNDLARPDTEDRVYENVLNTTLGISGAWASTDKDAFSQIFPKDWHRRRICAWFLMTQFVSRPAYTWSGLQEFVGAIEQLFHPANIAADKQWLTVSDANNGKNVVTITMTPENIAQTKVQKYYEAVFRDVCTLIRPTLPMNIHLMEVIKGQDDPEDQEGQK